MNIMSEVEKAATEVVESAHLEMTNGRHGVVVLAKDGKLHVAALKFTKGTRWTFEKQGDKWFRTKGAGQIPQDLYTVARRLMR